ncbi:MAG: glycosyltransferase [Actinobacteria bacterium]|nr:glycosyltransferase [Actinomycetota bacterium]
MRIAFVAGPDPGHAFPVIALARALRSRGHEVVVATGARWEDDLAAEGLAFVEIPLLAPTPRDDDWGYRIWGRAAEMARPLAEVLAEHRPEALVADTLTAAGGLSAGLLGVPWAETVPHWLNLPSRALPAFGQGRAVARTPLGRIADRQSRRHQRGSLAAGAAQARAARVAVGLPPEGQPTVRLVAAVPALEPARPDWPARTFLVGALDWEPQWPTLEVAEGDEPLVLVSDSTASGLGTSLARLALDALGDLDLRGVVTTTAPLDDLPAGWVAGRSRHSTLLERVACVVGPGGGGLVAKALSVGRPLVVVPLQGDQLETAGRVHHVGAGLRVRPGTRAPARLREAVQRVLTEPRFTSAAARAADGARGLGVTRAAQLIEVFLKRR